MPITGGQEKLIVQDHNLTEGFVISKDGIYYINAERIQRDNPLYTIKFYNLKTGSVSSVLLEAMGHIMAIDVSPDGNWLLYSLRKVDIDIWLIEHWQ